MRSYYSAVGLNWPIVQVQYYLNFLRRLGVNRGGRQLKISKYLRTLFKAFLEEETSDCQLFKRLERFSGGQAKRI